MLSRLVSRSNVASRQLQWIISNCSSKRSGGAGFSTYYDSQSGQHVPIHDENKVTAYLRWNLTQENAPSSSIIYSVKKKIGVSGMIMAARPTEVEGDQQILIDSLENNTSNSTDKQFTIFMHHDGKLNAVDVSRRNDINICFEYSNDNNIENDLAEAHNASNGRTSIAIANPIYYNEEDPVLVAARIASLIDSTSGGAYILLSPEKNGDSVDDDEMVQLCEELVYLDVVGPTIKSRLVVSALSDEQVEECLCIGISKYIIGDEFGLEKLRGVVEEQGKELVLSQ